MSDSYAATSKISAYDNACAPVPETDLARLNHLLSQIYSEVCSLTGQMYRHVNRIVGADTAGKDGPDAPERPVGESLPEALERANNIGSRLADLAQQISRLSTI